MLSPLTFGNITYGFILRSNLCHTSPIQQWLAFGKLPENPVVTPNSKTQVIRPSAVNKYLQTVIVKPIPTTSTSEG